jgi:predicted O-methyltransferase YrrM
LDVDNFAELLAYLERSGKSELARLDSRLDNPYYVALYTLIRWLRPRTVVETGVSLGVSSKIVLTALQDSGVGTLYSIDLPNARWIDATGTMCDDSVVRGYRTGHLVPRELKHRWNLIVGDSRTILPTLLDRIGPMDVFIHDSEHSYDHMMFEFTLAWPLIRESGLLISDDEDYNAAFEEFAASMDGRVSRTFIKNSDRHRYGLVWRDTLDGRNPSRSR